jgi:two-component system LytT family response regulator
MKQSIVRINRKISVPQSSIIRLESDSNYTIVHFEDRSKEVVATSLCFVHALFDPKVFVRINRSMVINIRHLKKLPDEPIVKIDFVHAKSIRVSRRRKKELRNAFISLREGESMS